MGGFALDQAVMDWLLERDPENAPVRALALRDLLEKPADDPELVQARHEAMESGPVPAILARQNPDGSWEDGKEIYLPKYTATIWQVIALAQMGADGGHPQVHAGCDFLINHAIGRHGGFSVLAGPSGTVHCLQGNIAASLLNLGYQDDPRMAKAIDWMARSITGEGFAAAGEKTEGDRFMKSSIGGPGFLCGANDLKPCAWGAVKAALALAKVPAEMVTPAIEKARHVCADFLLSVDPATADYPHPYAPKASGSWFKFGFPVYYITDILQILEALAALGLAPDKRLANALAFVDSQKDAQGRWPMAYTYNGKMWTNFEEKGKPSKWVTLRALRVLKTAGERV